MKKNAKKKFINGHKNPLILSIFLLLLGITSASITISPNPLSATTQINNQIDYQITITNDYLFDIFDFNFGDLTSKGFTFPNITVDKNSSKEITILFKPTSSVHENLNIPVSFKYFVELPLETKTYDINITDPNGFTPNYLPIKQGDSVRFNNKHTVSFNVNIEGNVYNIPVNSSITHQFNTISQVHYEDTYFHFYGTIDVLNKSKKEKAHNPNYDINWGVNINSILNPTTLQINNSKTNFEIIYGKSDFGEITIKNNGNELAESVNLSSNDWISFDKNNINIEPGQVRHIEYTIVPNSLETNNTGKTYEINIKIKASNSQEYIKKINVSIPYKEIIVDTDDPEYLLKLIENFCKNNPKNVFCSGLNSSSNTTVVYNSSDIPINVSKEVIYDIQKDLKTTMDSNERTNNIVKFLTDLISSELPLIKQKLNESLSLQKENEDKAKLYSDIRWIVGFFILLAVLIFITVRIINKKSYKKNLMQGQFRLIER